MVELACACVVASILHFYSIKVLNCTVRPVIIQRLPQAAWVLRY